MKTLILLGLASTSLGADGPDLDYALLRGSAKSRVRAAFRTIDGRQVAAFPLERLPEPARHLPLWLPPGSREPGAVIYDDGRGFRHDRGWMRYVLQATGTWRGFTTVECSYQYQGMQEADHWLLEARDDRESGFLLEARVSERTRGADFRAVFDLRLAAASDPALRKKLV